MQGTAALSRDCTGYNPSISLSPTPLLPLYVRLCARLIVAGEVLGVGTRCVCVCVEYGGWFAGSTDRLTFTVSNNA